MNTITLSDLKIEKVGNESILMVENLNPDKGLMVLDAEEVRELLRSHAVVLFSGFNPDMKIFEQFTDQFCTGWMKYQGGAHDRKILNEENDGVVYSVNFYFGREQQTLWSLPLHSDMSYQGYHPAALFFFCVQPSVNGGETALCDGSRVYRALKPTTQAFFRDNKIRYIRNGDWRIRFHTNDLEDVRIWCRDSGLDYSYDEVADVVTTEYVTTATPVDQRGEIVFCNSILPVLWQEDEGHTSSLVRLEDGSKIPADIVSEIREVTTRERVLVKMKKHDVAWLDNTRALHGRMAFDSPDRQVGIRMGEAMKW